MSEQMRTAIGTAIFLLCFGAFGYFLPTIMVAIGDYSMIAAGIFAALFILAFFIVFWVRSRLNAKKH